MTRSGVRSLTRCLFGATLLCLLWLGGGAGLLMAQALSATDVFDLDKKSSTDRIQIRGGKGSLDVAPSSGDSVLPPKPEYKGEPISLKLVDVSLVAFFRTISELTGLNILIDPDVKGTITINVEEVPWALLFEPVLRSHGLERTIDGNLVRIATKKQ